MEDHPSRQVHLLQSYWNFFEKRVRLIMNPDIESKQLLEMRQVEEMIIGRKGARRKEIAFFES